ncbi:DUF732 domain-containing protein [Mycobacterium noviomagense]|uniref:DUF732 domain-containing protein n=2 Tax=Mycobacterium noviomagense TaxID=459858 RepID=A0ABX3SZ21_9MYCO|nr:DUF732 domain-containing protein [Mycobacterium noviomagense]ORB10952.1 hypothetical protein BST37_21580 [Mycobacterium noviomagense]
MRFMPALASVCTLIALAGPGHADPGAEEGTDNAAFLASLRNAGITYNNADQAITAGHAVCGLIDNGESGLEVLKDLKSTNPGFTTDGAAQFAAIAARSYCPQQLAPSSGAGAK